jgi:hypothetical protein
MLMGAGLAAPVFGCLKGGWTIVSALLGSDTSERATAVARGISEVINCLAFVALLLAGLAVATFASGLARRNRRRRGQG